jgi:hypothetical protein
MSKYPDSPKTPKDRLQESSAYPDLDFPIDPDFLSLPPRLDPQIMLRRIAQNMAWRSTRPGEKERRLASKVDVEFVL